MLSPHDYYNAKRVHFRELIATVEKRSGVISILRLVVAIAFIVLLVLYFVRDIHVLFPGMSLILFLLLVQLHSRLKSKIESATISLEIVERELLALDNDYHFFPNGAACLNTGHPYSYDLDLFGNGGIYQMLCRCSTKEGERLLAHKLLNPGLKEDEIREAQAVIKELSALPDLLLNFRTTGALYQETDNDNARLAQWLTGDTYFINHVSLRFITPFIQLASIGCLVGFVLGMKIYSVIFLVIAINWVLLGAFRKKIKMVTQQIGSAAKLVDKYRGLINSIITRQYATPWLRQASVALTGSFDNLTRFKNLVRLFDSRDNGLVGPVMNTLFLFDFYCLLKLESWRAKNKSSILASISLLLRLDVFVCSSVYAYNHPEYCYPTIAAFKDGIRAKDLRHPLLAAGNAIGNDVSLGADEQFYLLTGANMTGKSTFIRTIGVSNVLFQLGLPLPAKEISLPLLEVYTSMRITDSVLEDVSYFKAELNRIKSIVSKVKTSAGGCLILLDEPLRGTNSADKQQGTRLLIELLSGYKAIGIIATHDTGLCDLEGDNRFKISNYHFDSIVNTGELVFDFKIKAGCSTSTNATLLMRQMMIFE